MTSKTTGRMSIHERAIREKLDEAKAEHARRVEKWNTAQAALEATSITINLLEALLETKEDGE